MVSAMIKQLGWMNMKQRHLYFTCIFMFKCLNHLVPEHMNFTFVKETRTLVTRSVTDNKLVVPRPHTEMFKRSIQYYGPVKKFEMLLILTSSKHF